MNNEQRVLSVWKLLRFSYGAVALLAGLDKVFGTNIIVDWTKYISPAVASMLPMSPHAFMVIVGVIEVAAALLVFSKYSVLGSYIVSAWLVLIALNLLMLGGYMDIAIRDVLLAIGSFATAKLGEISGHSISGKKMSNA